MLPITAATRKQIVVGDGTNFGVLGDGWLVYLIHYLHKQNYSVSFYTTTYPSKHSEAVVNTVVRPPLGYAPAPRRCLSLATTIENILGSHPEVPRYLKCTITFAQTLKLHSCDELLQCAGDDGI
jgi:hypothetical protein